MSPCFFSPQKPLITFPLVLVVAAWTMNDEDKGGGVISSVVLFLTRGY